MLGMQRGRGMTRCFNARCAHAPATQSSGLPPEPADDSAEENAPTSAERADDGARDGTLNYVASTAAAGYCF
jgi:hypothetical protein